MRAGVCFDRNFCCSEKKDIKTISGMKGSEPYSSGVGIRRVTFSCCLTLAWLYARVRLSKCFWRLWECVHIGVGCAACILYVYFYFLRQVCVCFISMRVCNCVLLALCVGG